MNVPYFAQWESRDLVEAILTQGLKAREDPLWRLSGAKTPKEYELWAGHLCGMACLKMILAFREDKVWPIIELAKLCTRYGGYKKKIFRDIKGLYYKPFTDFIKAEFKLDGQVCTNIPIREAIASLDEKSFFIASVHPSIRFAPADPLKKGGHLVLAFANQIGGGEVTFHNPSGFRRTTQEFVNMSFDDFNRFYAERGILIRC